MTKDEDFAPTGQTPRASTEPSQSTSSGSYTLPARYGVRPLRLEATRVYPGTRPDVLSGVATRQRAKSLSPLRREMWPKKHGGQRAPAVAPAVPRHNLDDDENSPTTNIFSIGTDDDATPLDVERVSSSDDEDVKILKVTRSAMAQELAEREAELELARKEKAARDLAKRIARCAAGSVHNRAVAASQRVVACRR